MKIGYPTRCPPYLQAAAGVGRSSEERLVQNNAHRPDVHLTIHETDFKSSLFWIHKKYRVIFYHDKSFASRYKVQSWAKSTIISNDF